MPGRTVPRSADILDVAIRARASGDLPEEDLEILHGLRVVLLAGS
jgi:hypothetical protein